MSTSFFEMSKQNHGKCNLNSLCYSSSFILRNQIKVNFSSLHKHMLRQYMFPPQCKRTERKILSFFCFLFSHIRAEYNNLQLPVNFSVQSVDGKIRENLFDIRKILTLWLIYIRIRNLLKIAVSLQTNSQSCKISYQISVNILWALTDTWLAIYNLYFVTF